MLPERSIHGRAASASFHNKSYKDKYKMRSTLLSAAAGFCLAACSSLPLAAGPAIREYIIYHEKNVPPSVELAARELRDYLWKASGCRLEIRNIPHEPMIALGDNPLLRKAGIDPEHLAYEEFIIRNHGGTVWIAGRDLQNDKSTPFNGKSYGTLYGTYEFLERALGIRWLIPVDERGTHIPRISGSAEFPKMEIREKPFFEQRSLFCDPHYREMPYFRCNKHAHAFQAGSALYSCDHMWQYMFPAGNYAPYSFLESREKTFSEHPEYFSLHGKRTPPIGNQWSLCLSAPGLQDEMVKRILLVQKHFKTATVCISPNDGQPDCECTECRKKLFLLTPEITGELNNAGAMHSRSWTPLVLENYRYLSQHLQEQLPRIPVVGFIYQAYEFAPVPRPAPMPENFVALMCPSFTAYGPTRLYSGTDRAWEKWLADWQGIFRKQIYYGLDFWINQSAGMPISPYPEMMGKTFRLLQKHGFSGVQMYFNKGFGFSSAGLWVMMKLQWNPNQDAEALLNEFLTCAYGADAAPHVRRIYQLSERAMQNYITSRKGQIGYHFSVDYLNNVCRPCYAAMEKEYLAGLPKVRTPEQKWRLELIGANLQLLRFHLEKLGLIPVDETSPLHLNDRQFSEFNQRRMPGGSLHDFVPDIPVTVHFPNAMIPIASAEKSVIPQTLLKESSGSRRLQYHQEIVIKPEQDMTVRFQLEYRSKNDPFTGRPFAADIPYFCVYDGQRRLIFTGIADHYEISFPARKGQLLYLIYCPSSEYRADSKWRIVSANTPYALGQRIKSGAGLYFWTPKDSFLYFMVPAGVRTFSIFMTGGIHDMALIDPAGKKVASMKGRGTDSIKVNQASPGWWRVDFFGGDYKYLRQSENLSGFWVENPALALDVRTAH